MKIFNFFLRTTAVFCLLAGISVHTLFAMEDELTLADVLQSKMVIQQAKPFKLWGTGVTGNKVAVKADWSAAVVAVVKKDGTWEASIDVPSAKAGDFGKHTIDITSGKQKMFLNDLLIGDLWLCSGQSNMTMYMKPFKPWHNGVVNYKEEIAAANFPGIRLFTVQKDSSSTPGKKIVGIWQECNPASVETFSAVSYYFGRELFKNVNIPIGLIVSGYGGAAAQAFTSRETLAADAVLKKEYLDPFDKGEKKGVTGQPTLIYNAMIYPLLHLSIKGIIWYQGESNAGKRGLYPILSGAMINNWRSLFTQGDLPFYFVQMPAYNWKKHDRYEYGYALFREEQQRLLSIKNTGMAVAIDVGDTTIIHPSRKREIGERLGKIALHDTYRKKLVFEGPKFEAMAVDKDKVTISYLRESLGSGLTLNSGSEPLHFFLAGADQKFYPAKAEIKGNQIVLHCSKVMQPVAVRYAFTNYPFTNLQNKEGLPAYPFRTDDWKDAKMLPLE